MKYLLTIFAILFCTAIFAQTRITTSPFKPLKPPEKSSLFKIASNQKYYAYRLVSPFAAYSFFTQQMSTGIGYGWNKMHFIDSTQTYYTDLSIFLAISLNGNIVPTPYNWTSIGAGVGFLNGRLMIIPCYDIPFGGKKGGPEIKASFGFKF